MGVPHIPLRLLVSNSHLVRDLIPRVAGEPQLHNVECSIYPFGLLLHGVALPCRQVLPLRLKQFRAGATLASGSHGVTAHREPAILFGLSAVAQEFDRAIKAPSHCPVLARERPCRRWHNASPPQAYWAVVLLHVLCAG